VNEYRIEEFKSRMNDPKYQHLTLVAIAYGCGFNSKSTFNSFFKEYTGFTPTEYKSKMKAESNN
jgi:AraC-like DNA-binding protein